MLHSMQYNDTLDALQDVYSVSSTNDYNKFFRWCYLTLYCRRALDGIYEWMRDGIAVNCTADEYDCVRDSLSVYTQDQTGIFMCTTRAQHLRDPYTVQFIVRNPQSRNVWIVLSCFLMIIIVLFTLVCACANDSCVSTTIDDNRRTMPRQRP